MSDRIRRFRRMCLFFGRDMNPGGPTAAQEILRRQSWQSVDGFALLQGFRFAGRGRRSTWENEWTWHSEIGDVVWHVNVYDIISKLIGRGRIVWALEPQWPQWPFWSTLDVASRKPQRCVEAMDANMGSFIGEAFKADPELPGGWISGYQQVFWEYGGIWVLRIGGPPVIIHFSRIFPYFPL